MTYYSSIFLFFFLLFISIIKIYANIFDFDVIDGDGNTISLSKYQDKKVILIVNVASRCGYTHINYRGLREMYDNFSNKGLEILAFPSNQFGDQEPGSNEEIQNFCKSYGLSFPIFAKIDVNGPNAHPLYEHLKLKTDHTQIGWNFEKFLIINGNPIEHYKSRVSPKELEAIILPYLEIDNSSNNDL